MVQLPVKPAGFQRRYSQFRRANILHPHKNVYKAGNNEVAAAISRFQFWIGIYPQVL